MSATVLLFSIQNTVRGETVNPRIHHSELVFFKHGGEGGVRTHVRFP
jgi:hypothetical protein